MESGGWRQGLIGLGLFLACTACGSLPVAPDLRPADGLSADGPKDFALLATARPKMKWPRPSDARQLRLLKDAKLPFLPHGHINRMLHIHVALTVTVDGRQIIVPAEIGIIGERAAEIHTHNQTGTLHIEGKRGRVYTLGQFFTAWGVSLKGARATVGGVPVAKPAAIRLVDKSVVHVAFRTRR